MNAPNHPLAAERRSAERKAYEPSMEEILASIRRIIADDQAFTQAAAPPPDPPAFTVKEPRLRTEPLPPSFAPQSRDIPARDIPAREMPAREMPTRETQNWDTPHREMPSRESPNRDVLSREMFGRVPPPPPRPVPPRPAQEAFATDFAPQTTLASSAAAPAFAASSQPSGAASTRYPIEGQFQSYKTAAIPPLRSDHFAGAETAHDVPPPPMAAPEPFAERAEPRERVTDVPLVSPQTDAAVSTAFGALIASQKLPSDEELGRIVRDMLRPMLKSWLDDNLPVLVERLVRAEIERVARGR